MGETLLTTLAVALRIVSNPLANVFQKRLTTGGLHPLLVNFLTYFFLSIASVSIAFNIFWPRLSTPFWIYSILAGIVGAVGNGFLVKALQQGDLSVLGPINAYKAVVGLITGIFLLGEWPSGWGVLGTALIIGGSYFVLDTAEQGFSWALLKQKAIQYRIWALVLTGLEAVLIKRIILESSVAVAFIGWCVTGALFALLFLRFNQLNLGSSLQKISAASWRQLGGLVLCIGVMQFTTNYAFSHMPVGYALSLFQLSAIVSVWLGYRLFQEGALFKKMIGTVIMLCGSVLIILLR